MRGNRNGGSVLLVLMVIATGVCEVSSDALSQIGSSQASLTTDGPTLDILVGEWLNQKYVDRLQETRSPKAALNGMYYVGMDFEKQSGGGYDWLQIIGFHEGVHLPLTGLTLTDNTDGYEPVFGEYPGEFPTIANRFSFARPFPPDVIEWHFEAGWDAGRSPATYVRIQDGIDRFVTRTVIAGTYADEAGEMYRFTENGVAIWPDTTFTFKIQVDTMFSEGDSFFVGKTHAERTLPVQFCYGYAWRDNKLYLYNTFTEEPVLHQHPEPFATLTPVPD